MLLAPRLHCLQHDCLQQPDPLEYPHPHHPAEQPLQKLLLKHFAAQRKDCSGDMDCETHDFVPVPQTPRQEQLTLWEIPAVAANNGVLPLEVHQNSFASHQRSC